MRYPKKEKNKEILILSIGIALATSPMLFSYNNNIAEAQTLIELSPDFATTSSCDVTGCPSVNINVLANDRPAGLSVTAIERQPSNGAVTINADNTITYTPNARFFGVDIFSYTASDGTATASTSVTVTVEDRTPPVILPETIPPTISQEASTSAGVAVTYTTPTATDNVDTSVVVNCYPVSGSVFPVGTTPVTCTATDSAGNPAIPARFTVIVVAPVTICHIPPGNPENQHPITVTQSDAENHIRQHGDFVLGSPEECHA